MAARKNPHHNADAVERIRGIIKARRIVERLDKFIHNEVEMTASQVTAALGLLRKVVPDLAAVEHIGEINHRYVVMANPESQSTEEWQQQHAPTIQ